MDQVTEEQKPEKRDVSRQTLVVLVVLAVVVSLLGTFTVLRETGGATKVFVDKTNEHPATSGKVSLTIVSPNSPLPVQESGATGQVTLKILPRS